MAVPSVQANLRCCHNVWKQVRVALLRSSLQAQQQANRRRTPAQVYSLGQKVCCVFKGLPFQVESQKLAPAVRLRLPASLKVHLTFHDSRVKPVKESELSPDTEEPPPYFIDNAPDYMVQRILDVRRGWQYLVDWGEYGHRGSLAGISWIRTSCELSTPPPGQARKHSLKGGVM